MSREIWSGIRDVRCSKSPLNEFGGLEFREGIEGCRLEDPGVEALDWVRCAWSLVVTELIVPMQFF